MTPFMPTLAVAAMVLAMAGGREPTDATPPRSDELLPVWTAGAYGYIDRHGNIAIEPRFTLADRFYSGVALAAINDGVGVRFGFIDRTGQYTIEPRFESARRFNEGLAAVRIGGKWGFIDRDGEVVVPPEYHEGSRFQNGIALVAYPSSLLPLESLLDTDPLLRFHYIDSGGVRISEEHHGPETMLHPLPVVRRYPLSLELYERFGYVGPTGRWEIGPRFEIAEPFCDGLAMVLAEDPRLFGFIDRTGNFTIPPQYESARSFSEGLAVVKIDGLFGVIDSRGQTVIEPKYHELRSFNEGLAAFRERPGCEMGYIDREGAVIIEPRYDQAHAFRNGVARVVVQRSRGYIDTSGAYIWHP